MESRTSRSPFALASTICVHFQIVRKNAFQDSAERLKEHLKECKRHVEKKNVEKENAKGSVIEE